jgi:hypothetical protein
MPFLGSKILKKMKKVCFRLLSKNFCLECLKNAILEKKSPPAFT